MAETPNHQYNRPSEGATNWNQPLNTNFDDLDVDVEIRGSGPPDSGATTYDSRPGSKYLDTDTGLVYRGTDTGWTPAFVIGVHRNDADVLARIAPAEVLTLGGLNTDYNTSGSVVFGRFTTTEPGVRGAVISGGGRYDQTNSTSQENIVADHYGTVGGGVGNRAGTQNGDPASDQFATVGGGRNNDALNTDVTIGGGNANTANGQLSTIGGGRDNFAGGRYAAISGGWDNRATGESATTAGGFGNYATGLYATVGGGRDNTAGGNQSTVAGGVFGAAISDNSFVWNDGTHYHPIPNSTSDGLSSNTAVSGDASEPTGASTFSVSATGGVRFITGSAASPNVTYIPSGSAGWSMSCSRTLKTNIDPVDPEQALAGVDSMDIATWEYTDEEGEGAGTTHIGPMAEEFHDAFEVGSSDEHINSINADGVALAAIQGLSKELDEKDERIEEVEATNATLKEENQELKAQNEDLQKRLRAVEEHLDLNSVDSSQ